MLYQIDEYDLEQIGYIQDDFLDRSKDGWKINSSNIVDYGNEGKHSYYLIVIWEK